jgi:signal transduction histidine kinase
MSFRARLLLGFLVVVLVPLAVLALGVRNEMRTRVLREDDRRAEGLAAVIDDDLSATAAEVGVATKAIAARLPDDPQFRAAALRGDPASRPYVLDYAAIAMRAAGLGMLQIRNDSGRIVSSGHFPSEFDRIDTLLPAALARSRGATLVATRTADGFVTAVAGIDSIAMAGRTFTVVGGRAVEQRFVDRLSRAGEMRVALVLPDSTVRSSWTGGANGAPSTTAAPTAVVRTIPLAYIDARGGSADTATARVEIARSLAGAEALRRSVDRWIVVTFVLATAAAVLAALWIAGRLSRPMEELAAAADSVNLERMEVGFAAGRDDEVGVLSRRLTSMVERLRASAARVRDAEAQAAVGELARQVNHDIKNGLAPIRNVLRHLAEVARDQPSELPVVFTERQGTLDSSVAYLETLAQNYARLSPSLSMRPSSVETVIAQVASNALARGASVRSRVAAGLPSVRADEVVLRRIIENLAGNGIDSLDGKPGEVTIGAERAADGRGQAVVRITVADTGRGMTQQELSRAFDDFYTTKPNGTGLGLSVVRRLVADLGGRLRVETEPGVGTTVSIELPVVPAGGTGVSRS